MFPVFCFCIVGVIVIRFSLRWYRWWQRDRAERVARIRVTATLNRPRDFSPEQVAAARAVIAGERALAGFVSYPTQHPPEQSWPTWPQSAPSRTAVASRTKSQPTIIDLTGPERYILAEFFPELSIPAGRYVRIDDEDAA